MQAEVLCGNGITVPLQTDPATQDGTVFLLAIFEDDPVKKAEYEKEAEPWTRQTDRMVRLGIRVVPPDRPHGR